MREKLARASSRKVPAQGTFRLGLADPERAYAAVNLLTELFKREAPRPLAFRNGQWEIELGDVPLDRIEYAFETVTADGPRVVLDPNAPPSPHGGRSVAYAATYAPPEWLAVDAPEGTLSEIEVPVPSLGMTQRAWLFSAASLAPRAEAPVLYVHDGGDYVRYARLGRFLDVSIARGALPPCRAVLLDAMDRAEHYSASPAYARALAREIAPYVEQLAPTPGGPKFRAALGASLGALSMLHAASSAPRLFGALGLQSGSFFRRELDSQESGFARFSRIERFVSRVAQTPSWKSPIAFAMTCGIGEENCANNRALERMLLRGRNRVRLSLVRDLHSWTAWRDGLHLALAPVFEAWRA